jgi:fucose 4-O-acetylase-like acetyltransferase
MASTSRDPWLDNAKMALVALVVLGHTWALLPPGGLGGGLYDFLYLWHMPAFVFVSGYLSRAFTWASGRMWQLVTTLAVPYLVFEAALALFRIKVGGENLVDLFTDPHFPLWYLPALIVWRLLAPAFRPLWGGVVVAVAVSLASGFIDGELSQLFDLARILGLLPFFVLGLKATPERLEGLRSRSATVLGAAAFAVIGLLALTLDRWASGDYLYFKPYSFIDASGQTAVLTRLLVLGVGMAGAVAWLAVVPRVGGWFARMGAATMVIYLFHGFAVKGLEYAGFPEWAEGRPWLGLAAATLAGLGIAFGLAAPPVRRFLQHVVDPFASADRRVDDAVALAVVVQEQERELEVVGEPVTVGR